MKSLTPYLNFDGSCNDAMTFYHSCLGGHLDKMSAAQSGMPVGPGDENRLIHARLESGPVTIMASDVMHGMPYDRGMNNTHMCIDCDDYAEQDRLYAALSAGGKPTMPLAEQFWGDRFGMLVDKFGVSWMFNARAQK